MKILAIVDIPDDETFENIKEGILDIWWDEKSFSRLYTANKWVKHPRGLVFKPMPEKKEIVFVPRQSTKTDEYMKQNIIAIGYNLCIDEILSQCVESVENALEITDEEADCCGVQFWHDD